MEAAQREDGALPEQESSAAERSLCGESGTCLGVLREADSSMSGLSEEARRRPALTVNELDANASIRVVPPVFGPLWERSPAFLFYKTPFRNCLLLKVNYECTDKMGFETEMYRKEVISP